MTEAGPKYPDIEVPLSGQDGNSFFILGRVTAAMRKHKVPQDEIKEFTSAAFECDGQGAFLRLVMEWVSVT